MAAGGAPFGGLIVARAFSKLLGEEPNLFTERSDVREQHLALLSQRGNLVLI
jgi:hypothetical protein